MGIFKNILGHNSTSDKISERVQPFMVERLEPRVMLSGDSLLGCLYVPDAIGSQLVDTSQSTIECEYLAFSAKNDSDDVQLPILEEQGSSESDGIIPLFSVSIEEINTDPEKQDKVSDPTDNINSEYIGLIDTQDDSSNDTVETVNNTIRSIASISIITSESIENSTVISTEDDGEPISNNDVNMSIQFDTEIEPRGPPVCENDSLTIYNIDVYVSSDEIKDSSNVESVNTLNAPDLYGLQLIDSDIASWEGQIIYLDFDGAEDVIYNGPVTVGPFDIPAFTLDGTELEGEENAIIYQILAELEENFVGSGIIFTIEQPAVEIEYSTIYIGGQ